MSPGKRWGSKLFLARKLYLKCAEVSRTDANGNYTTLRCFGASLSQSAGDRREEREHFAFGRHNPGRRVIASRKSLNHAREYAVINRTRRQVSSWLES
jgi:hypothetical protein